MDRRSMLRNIMLLAGVAAVPHTSAGALFAGPESLPAPTAKLLAAVADTIIPATDTPGALAAGVPDAFEKLLANWAAPVHRAKLVGALEAIDTKAQGETGTAFAALAPDARFGFLDAYDKANGLNADYAELKELIVTLYYLSEPGATVELRYEHNPGAWEPSIPVTAETRAYGGPSGF
ncbi:gluconate 2-dehydrogenase subunit 3 family protein [Sphingopyxis sp.]|uniref:gluconate 2-dehydrogenase subunit 3 family protein n=1 Tax=Sphingopyxis sp. TaxID=1908224 RepID=UPI002DF5EFAE|nr:gluconate 2-dehydrogenase subunit 3 family protein [Sphingopyxis sp.]